MSELKDILKWLEEWFIVYTKDKINGIDMEKVKAAESELKTLEAEDKKLESAVKKFEEDAENIYAEGWQDGYNTTSVSGYEVDWENSEIKSRTGEKYE